MNDLSAPGSRTATSLSADLQAAEREALRLLGGHARDPLTRMAVIFDLHVRRVAYRITARLQAWARAPASRNE